MPLQYLFLKLMSRMVCCLPYKAVLFLGKLAGRLFYLVAARQRRRALEQIQTGMSLAPREAEAVIKRLFIKLGQTFMEVMYSPALNKEKVKELFVIENRRYLEEALQEKRGVVFLTAHIGNWEWLGASLAIEGFPMTSIIKRQPNDQHTRILNEYRQAAGIEIFARGTTELVSAAKALKQGKILGFLADQDGGHDGYFLDFLGRRASTPAGPAVFARKFKCPVVPAFIVRQPRGGHRIVIHPPLYYQDTGNTGQDLFDLTVRMTKIVEDFIRSHPDEWLWFQKRWNTVEKLKDHSPAHQDKVGEAV